MKLKSIKKVSSAVRYNITVFDGNDCFIEDFKIDYIGMNHEELSSVLRNQYFKYENCKVRSIDTSVKSDGKSWLVISITV